MSEDEQIEGVWWIYGEERDPESGVLRLSGEDALSLRVTIPRRRTLSEMLAGLSEPSQASCPRVIFGTDAHDKPVTLFGCYVASCNLMMGQEALKIGSLAALRGLRLNSWTAKAVRAVSFQSAVVHRWLDEEVVEPVCDSGNREAWALPRKQEAVWEVCPGVRFRIDRQLCPSFSCDHFEVRPRHRLWLHFDTPRSLREITRKWVRWVTRLLSLLTGRRANLDEIECFTQDPFEQNPGAFPDSGLLVRKNLRYQKPAPLPHAAEMPAPFSEISADFGAILSRWERVSEHLAPVVDLFSAVEFFQSVPAQSELLFLAQALEAYHNRSGRFEANLLEKEEHQRRVKAVLESVPADLKDWTERRIQAANYKRLDERILDIMNQNREEAAALFGADFAGAAQRIRAARNYLSHYNEKGREAAGLLERSDELMRMNLSLRLLVWALLLKELGVSEPGVQRILRRCRDLQVVALDSAQQDEA